MVLKSFFIVLSLIFLTDATNLTVQGFFGQVRTIIVDIGEEVCVVNADLEVYSFDGVLVANTVTDKNGFYKVPVYDYGFYYVVINGVYNLERYPFKTDSRFNMDNQKVVGSSGTKFIDRHRWIQNDICAGLSRRMSR